MYLETITCSYLLLVAVYLVTGQNCDKNGVMIYEDMGCKPLQFDNNGCPINFKCKGIGVLDKCYYQGEAYSSESMIKPNSKGLSCEFGCICSSQNNNRSSVHCAIVDCYFGPSTPGCYKKFEADKCCSTGEVCPPFNDEVKCIVGDLEYRESERFSSPTSCHVCTCLRGWKGEYVEPFCKTYGCDVQLKNQQEVQNACAPLYVPQNKNDTLKVCCPKTWVCPDGSEKVEHGDNKSELKCKFGDKQIKLGSTIHKTIDYLYRKRQVTCQCKIPPLMSCELIQ